MQRFLKTEKKRRNRVCRKKLGERGEYNPDIDVFEYDTLESLIAKRPFKAPYGDCMVSEKGSSEKDATGRFYPKVRTEAQCKDVNGVWREKTAKRTNKRDDGNCWVNDKDAYCGDKYTEDGKEICNQDPQCHWSLNDCMSVSAYESLPPSAFPDDWPADIVRGAIQSYLETVFLSGEYKPPKHLPLFGQGNRCTSKELSKNALSLPQAVVSMVMRGMALHPGSSNRGLLVWHSTGSGKTCTATGVFDAFWDTPKNIVFVTSVEASGSNPPSNFHKCAMRFFPRFKGMSQDQVKAAFDKRKVKFLTFAQLAHYLLIANALKRVKKPEDIERHKNYLNDAVLVIDEVHNIFKPLPNQRAENDAVRKFLSDYNNDRTKNLKIVILTATPGNAPADIVALLNLVRDKRARAIRVPDAKSEESMQAFADSIKGLVSYFDMSKDYSKFPKVAYERAQEAPMTMKQFIKYVEAYNGELQSVRDYDALVQKDQLEKYYKKARKYSNMLYNFEKDLVIGEFSAKVPLLLENIAAAQDEKHYVYSAFYERRGFGGQGIPAIARFLETELGYKKLSLSEARKMVRALEAGESYPVAKRYVLALSAELSAERENLNLLVKAFNRSENVRGQYVHVFLASQGYNEGVDLKGVRHVHIFEPLLSLSAEQQTVGRAARFCSHSDLSYDKNAWTVKIHRYISKEPVDMSGFNVNFYKDRIEGLKIDIATFEEKLVALKGERGATATKVKDDYKKRIVTLKSEVRGLQSKVREVEKMNISNVNMIDDQLTKETFERVKELLAIYDVIRHAAIDYKLLKDFHV